MLEMQAAQQGRATPSLVGGELFPQARQDEHIVAQEVLDEFVIYDTDSHQVHNLNPTAAIVWQWCDGQTLPEAMAQRLASRHGLPMAQAESLVWLTLERLEKAQLLQNKVARPAARALDRRRMLKMMGAAAALPVVYSIVAPTAVHAMSVVAIPNCTDPTYNPGGDGTCYAECNCTGAELKTNGNCNACPGGQGNSGVTKSWRKDSTGVCYNFTDKGC